MLREIILLAVGAFFGLGATMAGVAAPAYFPNAPPWIWRWVFWGGIAFMALMAVDAAYLLFFRPKLTAGVLLNVGILFVACALISQFSSVVQPTQAKKTKGPPPSFRHIFDKDFPGYAAMGLDIPVKNTQTNTDYGIPARLFLDFQSGTKFLAVFLAKPNLQQTAIAVFDNLDGIFNYFAQVTVEGRSPGDTASITSASMIFSKMIYFYMEEDLPLSSQAQIENLFKQKGVTVQFRGQAYYTLHWNDQYFPTPS